MTFVGLDLHKRYITACALDAAGGVISGVRNLRGMAKGEQDARRGSVFDL